MVECVPVKYNCFYQFFNNSGNQSVQTGKTGNSIENIDDFNLPVEIMKIVTVPDELLFLV